MADGKNHAYELVFIAQPEIAEDALAMINDRLVQLIDTYNGQVEATELWGRRALAYPINRHMEGQYVLHRFEMDPSATDELERLLRFNEDVIRFLLIRTDE